MPRRPTILLLALLLFCSAALPVAALEPVQAPTPSVRPELELLSGVLINSSALEKGGQTPTSGNAYSQELGSYLAPYREHRAIRLANELTQQGFTQDAPPYFMLHLGPLPDLQLLNEYDPYLVERAGSREILEEFRLALRDLANESRFAEFAADHQDEYLRWANVGEFGGAKLVTWLEQFFGEQNREFHLILAPGMSCGGFGPTLTMADGRKIAHQILGSCAGTGGPPAFPAADALATLSLHEWGHSFTNPPVKEYVKTHPEQMAVFDQIFAPEREQLAQQAYGPLQTVMLEQVLRATTAIALGDLYGPSVMERQIRIEEERGFLLTRDAVRLIGEYQRGRSQYPQFSDFVPVLLDRLAAESKPLIETAVASAPTPPTAEGRLPLPRWLLIGGFLLIIGGSAAFTYQRRRRMS
jgi:hypothetical protein